MALGSRVVLFLFALLVLSLAASRSTQAAVDVTFDNSNPNANPDGSFPAGAQVYVRAVENPTDCSSVTIDWDDGTTDTGSSTTGVFHFAHAYSDAGSYYVAASEQCGRSEVGYTLTVEVTGASFSLDALLSRETFAPAAAGVVFGLITMALAVGPMSGLKRTQGAVGRPPEWRVGRLGRRKTTQSQYRAEVAAPPGRQGEDMPAMGEDIPPPIQGGIGYSVDTGRVIGPPPPPPVGTPITGPGASVQPVSLSLMPFLNAAWTSDGVTLSWGTPDYDPNQFTLLQYDVNRFVYGPNSTAPHAIFVGSSPAGSNNSAWWVPRQTFRFSTGGDVAGYGVEPVFRNLQTGGVFHGPGLFVKFGSTTGIPGLPF